MDQFGYGFDVAQDSGRRIHVRNSDDFVLVLLQRFLHLILLRSVANRSLQLGSIGAVGLEAIGKRIGKVSRVEDQNVVSGLCQVRCHLIPAQCPGSGNDEWLRCGIGGDEELPEQCERFAKDVDKGHADMRLTIHGLISS
jgi:hypothetical protein